MTELAAHPSFATLEDRLDLVGQRDRVSRILRGAAAWLSFAIAASLGAALLAGWTGQGRLASLICTCWLVSMAATACLWFVRPLLLKPRSLDVARLIEKRIGGLHNGLTNSLLLAERATPSQFAWAGAIFDEVLTTVDQAPLHEAVRWSQLKPAGVRLAITLLAATVLAILMPARLAHGWRQMLQPGLFVPAIGAFAITDVQPGDATLVAGQPLEISVSATGPDLPSGPPAANIIFDASVPSAICVASVRPDRTLHYDYRLDHVDRSLRYRIEVAGTQSNWFSVTVAPRVGLKGVDLKISPPAYAHLPEQSIQLSPAEVESKPLAVAQGSRVEIGADIDIPAGSAVLLVNSDDPVEMTPAQANRRFFVDIPLLKDAVCFVGVICNGQMVAKLPEHGFTIHTIPDAPPVIVMQWPARNITTRPTTDLLIRAQVSDDFGVASGRLLAGNGMNDLAVVEGSQQVLDKPEKMHLFEFPLKLKPEEAMAGRDFTVQVQGTDNRDLVAVAKNLGPQTAGGVALTIHFEDAAAQHAKESQAADELQALLQQLLQKQIDLAKITLSLLPDTRPADAPAMEAQRVTELATGQGDLRQAIATIADTFAFDDHTRFVQKTLQLLAANPAREAADLAGAMPGERVPAQQTRMAQQVAQKQQVIISTLRSLLARLQPLHDLATQPAEKADGHIPTDPEALKKLDEALKKFTAEQQRLLNQATGLAKKPVDNFDDADRKKLDELRQAQDDLDAFMEQQLSDFSKNAEQDLSNASLLKDLMQVNTEVTMAADALKTKPVEVAVALEDEGLESAKELESNLERWLANTPDRAQWNQEDPLTKNDPPLPELPSELQDMVGQLMEQQEDLDQQMEDQNANWADSMDKGVGWDAMDGPIADMSAKGVTGNVLPNDNEMQGRSGEGRSGKSEGEFVGDTAVGKGGRNTPTRLEPTPFEKGQIQDESKDAVGGATGGGKISGAGASGLEGPVPPQMKDQMKRLETMQASIRADAERLNAKFAVGRYDNFKLLQSIAQMRRVETDLHGNRYQNALRGVDVAVEEMEASQMLLGGRLRVDQDSTVIGNRKTQKEIGDAEQGDLPPAFSDALKEYYRKLSER